MAGVGVVMADVGVLMTDVLHWLQEAMSRHDLVPRNHPVQSFNAAAAIALTFGSMGHQFRLHPKQEMFCIYYSSTDHPSSMQRRQSQAAMGSGTTASRVVVLPIQ